VALSWRSFCAQDLTKLKVSTGRFSGTARKVGSVSRHFSKRARARWNRGDVLDHKPVALEGEEHRGFAGDEELRMAKITSPLRSRTRKKRGKEVAQEKHKVARSTWMVSGEPGNDRRRRNHRFHRRSRRRNSAGEVDLGWLGAILLTRMIRETMRISGCAQFGGGRTRMVARRRAW
jgi:hypothetical protein